MDLQKMIDAMSETWRKDRSKYHLTLGDAIAEMEKLTPGMLISTDQGDALTRPHSYRGYYSDLSLTPFSGTITVGALVDVLKGALGKTFQGYKGGDYYMDADTPLWVAPYSECGRAIMGIAQIGDRAVIITKDVD